MQFLLLFVSVFVSRLTGLRASNITYTSVRLDWNPVPEPFILGYRVLVQSIQFKDTLSWSKTYVDVAGLSSNTKYIIVVLPFHGLTDEGHPSGNEEKIIVTTKREQGNQFWRLRNSHTVLKILQTTWEKKVKFHLFDVNAVY